MKAKKARHDGEKIARRELKRDKAFQAELSRAWDVEKAPRSYHRTLEKTYEALPPELIVRRRPLRSLARGLAGFAAVGVMACIALFCVNLTEPRFAESLPGVGGVFQALNGALEPEPQPVETPAPVSSSQPEKETEPGFSSLPLEDNGIVLENAELMENGVLALTATLPYMGRASYSLVNFSNITRLGGFPVLTMADGKTIRADFTDMPEDGSEAQSEDGLWNTGAVLSQEPVTVTWYFPGVYTFGAEEEVTLTLYEAGWFWDVQYGGISMEGIDAQDLRYMGRRVTAEFTLRLPAGSPEDAPPVTAAVTEEYKAQGLKKITPEECRAAQPRPDFVNGYLAGPVGVVSLANCGGRSPGDYDTYFKLEVFHNSDEFQYLALNCYYGDDLVGTVYNYTGASDVPANSGTFLDEEIGPWVWGESDSGMGYYCYMVTGEDRTGVSLHRTVFAVPSVVYGIEDGYHNAAAVRDTGKLRFELADGVTGEVLISNLKAVFDVKCVEYAQMAANLARPELEKPEASPVPQSTWEEGVSVESEAY